LCRRPAAPLFSVSPEQETLVSRIFTGLLGVCLLAALCALIYVSQLNPGYSGARYAPAPATLKSPTRSTPNAQPSATQQASEPSKAAQQSAAQQPVAQQPKRAAGAAQSPAAAQPIAFDEVEVTMYSTPWCDICDRARDFLRARDVTLVEHNIDSEAGAARRLAKLNPDKTVPTFVIAGRAHVGWNPWEIQDALRDAARERYSARAPVTSER
jgi:glutaredoxin